MNAMAFAFKDTGGGAKAGKTSKVIKGLGRDPCRTALAGEINATVCVDADLGQENGCDDDASTWYNKLRLVSAGLRDRYPDNHANWHQESSTCKEVDACSHGRSQFYSFIEG